MHGTRSKGRQGTSARIVLPMALVGLMLWTGCSDSAQVEPQPSTSASSTTPRATLTPPPTPTPPPPAPTPTPTPTPTPPPPAPVPPPAPAQAGATITDAQLVAINRAALGGEIPPLTGGTYVFYFRNSGNCDDCFSDEVLGIAMATPSSEGIYISLRGNLSTLESLPSSPTLISARLRGSDALAGLAVFEYEGLA